MVVLLNLKYWINFKNISVSFVSLVVNSLCFKMRHFLFGVFLLVFAACEKPVFEEKDLNGTWKMQWIRCDNFHNSTQGDISFTVTDSTLNRGVINEVLVDTAYVFDFHFSLLDGDKLLIDTLYTGDSTSRWLGTHSLHELEATSFLLELETKTCNDELYKLVK